MTCNPSTYALWQGTKAKGKGKSDEDKECQNWGGKEHLAEDCKSKGKGHDGEERKGKLKGYGKGREDENPGTGWTAWGKPKRFGNGALSVHDNQDEDNT